MPSEDTPVGRIELEERPLRSTLNFVSDRQAIEANRQAIEELRAMLQSHHRPFGPALPAD